MRSISRWASHHRWSARFAIACCFLLLHALALSTGYFLEDVGVELPTGLLYALVFPVGYAWFTYPTQQKGTYAARKLREVLVAAVGLLQVVCIANGNVGALHPLGAAEPVVEQHNTVLLSSKPGKTVQRKNLRGRVRAFRKAFADRSTGEQVAIIALAVLAAVALLYLLAALSCSLACAGSEGLAILVALLGSGLIMFLLVRLVQRVTGKRKRRHPAPENS